MDHARSVCPALFDRAMHNADIVEPENCWNWILAKDRDGYGVLKVAGKNLKAHKVMYGLFRPGDDSPLVRHLCNNPGCVNPLHLRGGTHKENSADRVAAGRGANLSGERNGRAKLSSVQVLAIRNSSKTGAEIARQLGVSKVLVCRIRRSAAWNHI